MSKSTPPPWTPEPKRIYLEPPPGDDVDRMWCEEPIEDDWVEYVRADTTNIKVSPTDICSDCGCLLRDHKKLSSCRGFVKVAIGELPVRLEREEGAE